LGNTALAQGDIPSAIASYDECLTSTGGGKALENVRRDAAINREFALAQARALAVPQGESSDEPKSQRPERRRGPDRPPGGDDQGPEGPPEGEPGGGNANSDADGRGGAPPAHRRRLGGAGGARPNSGSTRGNSPVDRLDAALDHIRAAQSRRVAEEPPPEPTGGDAKDW
jgi:Ca-activated chloride channel family protein